MNEIYSVLAQLEDTSSRNEKIDILKRNKDLPYLKEFFQYALDPMKVYGIKKVPEPIKKVQSESTMQSVLGLFDSLAVRLYTGNEAIEQVAIELGSTNERGQEVIRRIIAKDPKCGVQESTVNKVWGKGTIPKFDVMLCAQKNEKTLKKMHWPAVTQIKYDGLRVVFIVDPNSKSVTAHTRSGRVIETFGIFDDYLLDMARRLGFATMFDGEMIAYEDGELVARKTSNGIMTKAVKGTATKEMLDPFVFVCWDIVPVEEFKKGKWDMPYEDRFKNLDVAASYQVFGSRIEIPEYRVLNQEEVEDYFKEVIEQGLEGLIVKNPEKGWEAKRVDHHIKYKAELEMDLEIIEVNEGTGKYEGMMGHITCASKDRKLIVGVGTGFSDEQRTEYYTDELVGKIVAVKYNEVIDKKDQDVKSLFLPVFVEIREDKTEADNG